MRNVGKKLSLHLQPIFAALCGIAFGLLPFHNFVLKCDVIALQVWGAFGHTGFQRIVELLHFRNFLVQLAVQDSNGSNNVGTLNRAGGSFRLACRERVLHDPENFLRFCGLAEVDGYSASTRQSLRLALEIGGTEKNDESL